MSAAPTQCNLTCGSIRRVMRRAAVSSVPFHEPSRPLGCRPSSTRPAIQANQNLDSAIPLSVDFQRDAVSFAAPCAKPAGGADCARGGGARYLARAMCFVAGVRFEFDLLNRQGEQRRAMVPWAKASVAGLAGLGSDADTLQWPRRLGSDREDGPLGLGKVHLPLVKCAESTAAILERMIGAGAKTRSCGDSDPQPHPVSRGLR
jgi:hypothetical protein